ncbi:MAG: DNA repair protein RadA [Candidatus Eisenbacteria bacterium]|nr:DNA repair protein RadA [Candidatus Eisenbacteria bacterium]
MESPIPGPSKGSRSGAARAGKRAAKVQFLCSECGDAFPQWFGRCPSCEAWNTLKEFRAPSEPVAGTRGGPGGSLLPTGGLFGGRAIGLADDVRPEASMAPAPPPFSAGGVASQPRTSASSVLRLDAIPLEATPRIGTGIGELDRILGGGLVPGSVVLVGGDPGIGKSTLLLQAAGSLVGRSTSVLYVSGEESAAQIRLRSERLPGVRGELQLLAESNLELVAAAVELHAPEVLVIDSIQSAFLPGLPAAPGSLLQVRESALGLLQMAKQRSMAVLLVGHVTKDGQIAGPKTLEHMVDTVLYMEGERYQHYRILRSVKNRFGGVDEIGVFEMADDGLREVPNPSQVFLSEHTAGAVGSVVVATLEGTRALLIEMQALVHETRYNFPQRVATGYEARRLEILLAVLAKRGGIDTSKHDVFVNVAGGLKVAEPGVDLGVLLAVASSRRERPPYPDRMVLGEVGLAGEVRRIAHPERRIAEAARLGYRSIILPAANARDLGSEYDLGTGRDKVRLIGVSTVFEALHEGLQKSA